MGKKVQKKKKNHVPFRLNVLFVAVFLLFSILILRLGVLQIVQGEEKRLESEAIKKEEAKKEAPRGKIFDSYGNVVVDNKPYFTLTYTKTSGTKSQELYDTAKWIAQHVTIKKKRITEKDKQEFFIFKKSLQEQGLKKLIDARISAAEAKKFKGKELDNLLQSRITKDEIQALTKEDLNVLAVRKEMSTGYAYSPSPIKKELTDEEISVVSENLDKLPGIDVMPDADRQYPFGDSLKTIFGQVKQIPREKQAFLQALNYDNNDQIGVSGIESQYEDTLRGTKEKSVYMTNPKTGKTIGDPKVIAGKRGKDLVLSVDMDLQHNLENIVEQELKKAKARGGNELMNSAYIVMMNPTTGGIYAIAGKKYEDGKYSNDSYGALFNAFEMGSAVKGATVLTGLHKSAISTGEYIYDAPVKIGNTTKKSYTNMGSINELTALERSSNVYMFNIAMRLGKYSYNERKFYGNDYRLGYNVMRYYFSQFGLGIRTGIDFPNESTGYNGGYQQLGNMLDLAIGQFDTYTPVQMVQYVSTIANGGYRVQPRLVKEIREPSTETGKEGRVVDRFEPKILNKIDMRPEYINRVQQGFWQVMHGSQGTAKDFNSSVYHNAAGKTGTAEVKKYDSNGNLISNKDNHTLVGYAPFDKPEVAFAVVAPFGATKGENINKEIGKRALEEYWKLKEKRKKPKE
ncbi:penicillin-binding protein 2A [Fictibacillus macauensis ZFHKF-1]|uniref:Penicillin-binding protein 2A n=1 Tax=Fictibacillus macauensis ZFHKF-1 TaxID=1196324 RepID=I8J3G1_9BACL|nr:penicillin-binding protein 2 [Fictibacillus macauensis]EIT86311.1 penicillin-binding protein 2A [Fictibacillus macauensis ZFHKF-1]